METFAKGCYSTDEVIIVSFRWTYIYQLAAGIVLVLLLSRLFHEMGHGAMGVVSGGTIDRMILGLNARIHMSGASYNRFTLLTALLCL